MSYLPPVLTGSSISGTAGHMVIDLTFDQPVQAGSGSIIVTDGALQTVIDRASGLPTTRIVGATQTYQVPLSMVSFNGNTAEVAVDGLSAGHGYRVFILPGALQANGQPFAGVTNAARLAFVTPPAADTTPPALLQMSMDKYALSTGKSALLTMTFSESVSIDPTALAGANVSVSGLASSDGGITWHATVTANPGVDATIGSLALDMQKVVDHANNKGIGSSSLSYSVDTKAPTVSAILLAGTSPVLSSDATVTVTFSEKVDLTAAVSPVIVAPHATVSGLHTIDGGITWVASLVPQSGTIATGNQLYVDLGQVRDLAGNPGAGVANAGTTYIVDTQGPGFKDLSLNGAILSQGRTVDVTIHMQQALSVFDSAALKAPHATVENVHTTDDGHTWVATLRGNAGASISDNTLSLDMSLVRDTNGVAGSGIIDTPNAYRVDTVAPTATLALAGAKVSAQSSVTVTITFSETMQSLDPGAIKAPNAAVVDLASTDGGRTWVAKLVPTTQSGTASGNTVTLDMSMVRDLAGNAGAGNVMSSTTYGVDTQPPTAGAIALSDSHVTTTTGPTLSVTFSEAVNLDATAFILPHAKLTNLHSGDGGITWSGTVLADGSGNAIGNTVSLDLGKVTDLYGNAGNGTVASGSYDVQVTAPTATLTLGGNQVTKQTVVSVTVVFSQAVTGLTAAAFSTQADIVLSGLNSSDGGKTWTGTLSTSANIQAVNNVFSLDLSKVHDVFGNVGSGTVSASTTYNIDTAPPAATLALSSAHLTPSAGATLTVTFTEAVKALDPTWFSTPHALLSNLTTSDNKTWTGTLAATAGGDSSGNQITLDMSKVADLAGNSGAGSTIAPTSYDVTHPPTQSVTLALDQASLANGNQIVVTMHFNLAVPILDPNAITAPNAVMTDLRTIDNGFTWAVTLAPQSGGAVVAPTNAVSVDLSKLVDSSGMPGSGIVQSPNYAVDTTVAAYVKTIIAVDDNGPSMFDLVTNDAMASLGGILSAVPGEKQHVELTIDGKAAGPVYFSGTSWAYPQPTSAPLADGVHTISVRIVDDAGHASSQLTQSLTIDTVAPHVTGTSIVGGTSTVPGTVDVTQPLTISFSEAMYWHGVPTRDLETSQTVYRDIDNAVKLSDSQGHSYMVYIDQRNLSADGKTLTLPAGDLHLVAGGTYNVGLPQALTDQAGNMPDTAGFSFQTSQSYVDTSAPFALVAQVTNQMGEYGIGHVIQIAVRFNEPVQLKSGATVPVLALNNGTHAVLAGASFDNRTLYFDYKISTGDAQPDNMYQLLDLKDASSLAGAVTDLAGNALDASHIQFTGLTNPLSPIPGSGISIDATPPAVLAAPLLDPASDSGVKGDSITNLPVLTGSGAEANAWISLYDVSNNSPMYLGDVQADASGNWKFTNPLHIDGSYKLAVTQQDEAGNESPMSGTLSLVLDTVAAGPNDIHVANSYSPINLISAIATPTLTGNGMEAGATIKLYEGSTLLGSGVVNSSGVWSITTGTLSEGTHSISLTQTDIAGNVGFSPGFPLVIDLTTPAQLAAPVLDPGSDSGVLKDLITNVKQPLVTGTGAEANAKIELYEGDLLLGSATSDASGNWQVKPNADHALADGGVHALTVRQIDSAGNVGARSAALSITIDTIAPTVAGFTSTVPLGTNFEIWFSEPVRHDSLTGYASVFDNFTGALFKPLLNNPDSWSDNVTRDGHASSVWHFTPTNSGWVELTLTGVQDAAGNVATIPIAHYNINAPQLAFYLQPQAIL
ncbi:hypothetical protein GCM10027321_40490 [Massilia terrae]|uniref:Ig-like domain-containing protein n=1 Tax=Massilia terrae TaxID=1811224 RepID=A0ABT2D3M5_9BURK|nr:Ig-like domain-containing protein [Massilia terrae]MCS0660832.1 Ig-like domain-containing protein [Massilia terrae]